ncbi:MAG TPA: acyl-CoA thioesterase [Anaerohalosphaeraceae bacterium]|jgi:acyl-CoA hydrolase|nr:acyl-CoA thioesterase [Anaerohalosphaeraceae bacterium]
MDTVAPESRPSRAPSESAVETRFLLMPSQANPFGTAFGGAILAQIDMAASMAAQRHCQKPVVTAAIDSIQFEKPVYIGDQVLLRASVNYAGRSSMEVGVQVIRENPVDGRRCQATTAYLTFVAIDEKTARPVPVPAVRPQTPDEIRRYENAQIRMQARKELRQKVKIKPQQEDKEAQQRSRKDPKNGEAR